MQKSSIFTLAALLALAGFVLVLKPEGLLRGADDAAEDAPAAAGSAPATNPQPSPAASEEATRLIQQARQRLFSYSSVKANLREFVSLGERRFEAEGSYLAGSFDPLPKLRLEYRVRVGNTEGTLIEICDGQILRTQRTVQRVDLTPNSDQAAQQPQVTVTRRDVRKILEAVYQQGETPQAVLQAELGLGGLPALLASIERTMVFESVRDEQAGGRTLKVVDGAWKPEFLTELRKQFAQFNRSPDPYLPDSVSIHLDGETLFPVRLVYWQTGSAEGAKPHPVLTLEFTDVRLNEPVSGLAFEFPTLNNVDEQDVTEQFIEAIKGANPPAPAAP